MRPVAALAPLLLAAAAASAQVSFSDRTAAQGIQANPLAVGCSWGDYDGDGWPDLHLANNRVLIFGAPNQLYHNGAGTGFADQAPALAVDDGGTAFGAAWGDYDNDGQLDLFLVRGVFAILPEPHLLFTNRGPSTRWSRLEGGTPELPVPVGSGRSAAWADYDNDGWLDLLVTNGLNCFLPGRASSPPSLLRNRGDGTFAEVSAAAGLRPVLNGHGVAWGDYDNDGWPDLFLVNHGFPDLGLLETNVLYRNRRDGTFEDVTAALGVRGDEDGNSRGCFGAAWADYDNDGWLDLYVTCGYDTIASIGGFSTTNLLYRNRGGSGFSDVSLVSLTADPSNSSGCAWGDYDNDARIDLYVANGPAVVPAANRLFRNTGILGLFSDEAPAAGVDVQAVSQAAAWADYDRDGQIDLSVVTVNGGGLLFGNDGGGGNWIELRLKGVRANRAGVGARVVARTTRAFPPGMIEQLREVSGGSGYLSQNDLAVHFGLGGAAEVDLEVRWPGPDFCVQPLGRVAANQVLDVVETCAPVPQVLRRAHALPLSAVFPLPAYAPLPGAGPWSDPQPVLLGPDPLLFYQVELGAVLSLIKSSPSVALHY